MDMLASREFSYVNLLEHAAVCAWNKLVTNSEPPERIEVIEEEKGKTAVYRLVRIGMADTNIIAKRCKNSTAMIEHTIYADILPHLPISMLDYYGCVKELSGGFTWLFLEDVNDEMYDPRLKQHRVAAAEWLGAMNTSVLGNAKATGLPSRSPRHYHDLLQSVRETIILSFANPELENSDLALLKSIVKHCDYLAANWERLTRVCEDMPQTLVHGDFIHKNVGVRTRQNGIIILPFDWENAGWGVPAEDISRVDITTYWRAIQNHWPLLIPEELERLAHVGRIFRCLVFLNWIAPRLNSTDINRPIFDLRLCKSWLEDLIMLVETWS